MEQIGPNRPGETDLLSNATRIVPNPEEDPRPWLADLASGNGRVLTFVHEATHNWCFSSAVVHAQVYLASRIESNSIAFAALSETYGRTRDRNSPEAPLLLFGEWMRAQFGDPRPQLAGNIEQVRLDLELAVYEDMMRLEAIRELMRPLAEGLALFAEYDALSRSRSKASSPIPGAVASNFVGRDALSAIGNFVGSSSSGENLLNMVTVAGNLIMEGARLSPEGVNAKASVLAQPLSSRAGGYLPGYLAVKSLWRHLYRQESRLYAESDLALAYIRSFFFEDLSLAATLLAPSRAGAVRDVNSIIQAFSGRLDDFRRVTPADVKAFEDHMASESEGEDPHAPGMLRSVSDDQGAIDRYVGAIKDYHHNSIAARIFRPAVSLVTLGLNDLLSQRPLLIACSVPVTIEPGPAGASLIIWWEGRQVFSVPSEDVIPSDSWPQAPGLPGKPGAEGRLDVLLGTFGTTTLSRAAVVSQGDQAISCTAWGPDPSIMRQAALAGFASREKRLQAGRNWQVVSELIVQQDLIFREERDDIRAHLTSVVDEMYRDTALKYARSYEAVDLCAELMKDDGLYALLRSANMLKRISLLGLVASVNSYRTAIEEVFDQRNYDLEGTLSKLAQCWDEFGFPPAVYETGDNEEALLIPLI